MSEHGDGTRVVRAGLPAAEQGEPFLPGPVFAAPFHLSGDPEDSPAVYGRYGNPTWARYERALGELEGGEAVLFASGMAAGAGAAADRAAARRRRGDRPVLLPRRAPPRQRRTWSRAGSRCAWRRPPSWPTRSHGAALLWLESPSNPKLEVYDIARAGRRPPARAGALMRGRQHHRRPAAPAAARPRRRLRAHERHQAPVGPRRPDARLRDHPRRRARAAPARLAPRRRRDPRALRGLARPPLARHARRCGSSAAARTPARWPSCSRRATT